MLANQAKVIVRLRRVWVVYLGLFSTLLGGCAVPEAPEWDVGLSLPFSSDPIAISDFLPAAVSIDTVLGVPVFTIQPQSDSRSYDLAQLCGAPCTALDGQTAAVPGFSFNDSIDVALDSDLVAVDIVSAQLRLTLNNGLNFDPLRPDPNPALAGFIVFLTRDAGSGALLDSTMVSGASQSFPPNSSLQVDLNLSNVQVKEGLRTEVILTSPFDGQTTLINTGLSAGFAVTLDQLSVSAITVVIDGEQLDEVFTIDLDADLRDEFDERAQSGSFELELTHDLEINGNLEVSIAGSEGDLFSGTPGTEIRLQNFDFSYAPNGRVAVRALSEADLQFIAQQQELFVGFEGVASGSVMDAGRPTSRIRPDQSIETRIKVTTLLRVGG